MHLFMDAPAVRRFLETCTKTHPPELRVKLNLAGFPMRPGRAVCRSYLRDGFCTSIKACSHHHPNLEPVRPGEPDPPNLAAYDPPAAVDVTGDENVHQQTGESTGAPKAMQRPKYVPAPGKGYEVVEPDWLARFPQRPDVAPCADFLRDAFCPCASYFSLQFALAVFRAAMPGICHGLARVAPAQASSCRTVSRAVAPH